MSERVREILTVGVLVAVLLGVFLALQAWRRSGATPPAERSPAGTAPAVPDAVVTGGHVQPAAVADRSPGAPIADGRKAPAVGPAEAGAASNDGGWRPRPAAEFSATDLAGCGRGVRADLGRYGVSVGDEFTVYLSLSAPALESCTVVVRYDHEALALIPQSARPEGLAFREGIEAYAKAASGKLVIIHTGVPGKKNLDAAEAGPVVSWRMKALRSGETQLQLLPETSFTSGRGEDEKYEVTGGAVSVR